MSELGKVKSEAAKAAASRARLEALIRQAHAEGSSLRAIAHAAGVSHEQVRRIVSPADASRCKIGRKRT